MFCVDYESASIDWVFIMACVFLPFCIWGNFFNWMLDIVNFTSLDAGYFCNQARAYVPVAQKVKLWQRVFAAK